MPMLFASALLIAMIASVAACNLTRPEPLSSASPKQFVINLSEADRISNNGIALSPDGKTLVYIGIRDGIQQLYRRSLEQVDVVPIPGTEGGEFPFFSPDGQWVGFFTADKLKKVALAGGPPVTLCDITANRNGASWFQEDAIVFSIVGSPLLRVPASGGTPQPLSRVAAGGVRWMNVLPGGRAVLLATALGDGVFLPGAHTAVLNLETGEQKVLLEGTHPRFIPSGHIVFARPDSLWAVSFDAERLELTGSPRPVLEGVQVNNGGLANYSIADDGSLVYLPSAVGERQLVWVARDGTEQPLAAPARNYGPVRLSPNSQQIATMIHGNVWIYDVNRNTLTQLTFEPSFSNSIAWTPDRKITYEANKGGSLGLFWMPVDGGMEERLATSEHLLIPGFWSPDGKRLAFTEANPSTGADLWVLSMEEEHKLQPFLRTPFHEGRGMFSPDGQWLAYISDESGRNEVYVQPYPGPGGKWQISSEGGTEIVWANNGEIFYRNGDKMMGVETTTQPSFSARRPRLLFEGQYAIGARDTPGYDVTPDGQRFVMVPPIERAGGQNQESAITQWVHDNEFRDKAGWRSL